METKLLNTTHVKQLVTALKKGGFDVDTDKGVGYRAFSEGKVIFMALRHSNGKHYICRYDTDYIVQLV